VKRSAQLTEAVLACLGQRQDAVAMKSLRRLLGERGSKSGRYLTFAKAGVTLIVERGKVTTAFIPEEPGARTRLALPYGLERGLTRRAARRLMGCLALPYGRSHDVFDWPNVSVAVDYDDALRVHGVVVMTAASAPGRKEREAEARKAAGATGRSRGARSSAKQPRKG
jgi:hypothetical protein